MATNTRNTDAESDSQITVTAVWPGQFELSFDSNCSEMPVATTHTLDRDQLRAVRRQIDTALR